LIDEVRVYNRALTAAEIQTDMNTPIGGAGLLLEGPVGTSSEPLDPQALKPLIIEALDRWEHAGASSTTLAQLRQAQFSIVDLPGPQLGFADQGQIWIDVNAAGVGWFVDSTPADDQEFSASAGGLAAEQVDLLTVVMHELGHLQSLEHDDSDRAGSLMSSALPPGVRRLPEAPSVGPGGAGTAIPGPIMETAGAKPGKRLRSVVIGEPDVQVALTPEIGFASRLRGAGLLSPEQSGDPNRQVRFSHVDQAILEVITEGELKSLLARRLRR
jgi:hypothetical protein